MKGKKSEGGKEDKIEVFEGQEQERGPEATGK